METGSELSKTVAIFIVQKILLDDMGLNYICQTYERFYAVGTVLSNMVLQLQESQTVRLLKHVVRCFLRFVMPLLCNFHHVSILSTQVDRDTRRYHTTYTNTQPSLSDNARAREALRQCLPEPLRDATFSPVLRDDAATKRCLAQLLINLSDNVVDAANGGAPPLNGMNGANGSISMLSGMSGGGGLGNGGVGGLNGGYGSAFGGFGGGLGGAPGGGAVLGSVGL